jgi:Bacterial regulatory proteins, tetR family
MSYPAEHCDLAEQKIVRSARRLFNRRGFDTLSIDDVMADAGLTQGSGCPASPRPNRLLHFRDALSSFAVDIA